MSFVTNCVEKKNRFILFADYMLTYKEGNCDSQQVRPNTLGKNEVLYIKILSQFIFRLQA